MRNLEDIPFGGPHYSQYTSMNVWASRLLVATDTTGQIYRQANQELCLVLSSDLQVNPPNLSRSRTIMHLTELILAERNSNVLIPG